MQLRSGTQVSSPAFDTLPSVRKRKHSFQTSPSKRRKPTKDRERTEPAEDISPQQGSSIYSSLGSVEPQSRLRSLSPRRSQGNEHSANSFPQKRKRSSITIGESHLKRAPLTARNLKNHSQSNMPRPRKDPSIASSTSTTTTTTTDKGFGVQLNKNGIYYGRLKTEKPEDIAAIKEYLNRARESNSPDETAYDRYVEQVEYCDNELSMQSNVWPLLAKRPSHTDTPGYTANYNFQWTEVESPLTFGLSDAKPDISEGYRRDQYPAEAREALGGALAPTQYNGAMPTFCVEWKGPDGIMPSAEKQCAYDGALMVDAAYDAHKYMKKDSTEFFGKTQALTVALNGEYVHLYGNHVLKRGSGLEYHQYPLQIHKPRDSLEDLKDTYKQLRNAQDWTRERATRTKDDLHAYAHAREVARATLSEPIDELAEESFQSPAPVPPAPVVTPPSTTTSSTANVGEVRRRGKSKKKKNGPS